jgi:CO/xanthine dehydrogenase Mo-binding subunit
MYASFARSAVSLSLKNNPRLDSWVRFEPGGTVTVLSGKVELGQGIVTAIAQIAAEELGVPPEKLSIVAGDTRVAPDEWYTAGSQSIEVGGAAMRLACAEVRQLFLEQAARRFEVAPEDLSLRDGVFELPGTDLRASYWDLLPQVSLARESTGRAQPKPVSAHAVVGRSAARRDIPAKLAGAAFVHDLELPGMLHARVARPPALGAALESFDAAEIRKLPGVVAVVRNGSFIAVACEREEQAVAAAEEAAHAARWRRAPELPEAREIAEYLQALPHSTQTVHRRGEAPARVARRFDATYSRPYLAHASIGPSCAVARFSGGRLTVWSHTQGPHHLRAQIALALGVPTDEVDVIHRDGAGCYGHNGADDVALDAALVARACGRPVRLQWSREDELAWSPFGSAMAVRIGAGVDGAGRIVDWKHEIWSHTHIKRPGWGEGVNLLAAWMIEPPFRAPPAKDMPLPAGGADRNAVPLYDFGHDEVVVHFIEQMPLRVSALRALGAHANVFAIESMLDEIARALGADPLEYRLRHLSDARARAVIEAAASAAGWGTPLSSGGGARGRGIGFARYKNASAYCAVVAEVEVAEVVRLRRVFAAVDAGQVINPDGLVNQIEGGIVQAASWALKEAVRWDRDGVRSRSWDDYPILRFGEAPEIKVVVLGHREQPPLGAGECAAGPVSAAIANALHDALGVRARHMPFTPERIARLEP